MDVRDIVDLMGRTSIGIDAPTKSSIDLYLKFLNLYHFELYNKVAYINSFISKDRIGWIDPYNNTLVITGDVAAKASDYLKVYNIDWIKTADGVSNKNYLPFKIKDNVFVIDKPIGFFEDDNNWVSFNFIPNPSLFDIDTEEEDIPYPIAYHQVLIYGANYHMYQNEGGLRSSAQFQFNESRKKSMEFDLIRYLTRTYSANKDKKRFSTYSEY